MLEVGPKISVIIVVLNGAHTIRRAIESVICQTYKNIELIIIDGGSTDGTNKIILEYKSSINYYESQKDSGIYFAMNKAIMHTTGDWQIFLGCDDVLLDCFHLVIKKMKDHEKIYYGDVIRRSIGDVYTGKINTLNIIFKNICHQAIFYPKWTSKINYNTKYKFLSDYNHNIVLWGIGIKFEYLKIIICDYNNCGSASNGDINFNRDKYRIICKNIGYIPAALWQIREFFAYIYRKLKYA